MRVHWIWLVALLVFLASALITSMANAQQGNCAQRDQVVERLAAKYGEALKSRGLVPNNGVIELYSALKTGTWTIVITLPNGMTCLVAAGSFWEDLDRVLLSPQLDSPT